MQRLIVRHTDAGFAVERSDGKTFPPVQVKPPTGYPVPEVPDLDLAHALPWYLERFLEHPFPPRTEKAEHIRDALRQWGRDAFAALFTTGRARDAFHDATHDGRSQLCLAIHSDDPRVLSWPWEALEDADAAPLALEGQIERRLNHTADPDGPSENLPEDRVNILLVTARPFGEDVGYRSISRPLVELIARDHLPAHVTVLRPPTFARLQEVLEESKGTFHVLHFDGHGGYGTLDPHKLQGPQGSLLFETDTGQPDPVSSEQLRTLLRRYRLPVVVLNACQSAKLDEAADPFASVAASLVKGGVRSVVAMAHSLYVSGAKHFLPAFYGDLFKSGNVAQAVCAGRRKMYEKPGRVCARGEFPLSDWMVPVLYQQEPIDLSFATTAKAPEQVGPELPEGARDEDNPYRFIGRDRALLALERALRRPPAGLLIQGLAGVGKTTLSRGFLQWLKETNGLDAAIWIDFREVRTAEYVVNSIVGPFFGADALAAPLAKKVDALAKVLREKRAVIVWDNFESATGVDGQGQLPSEDQQQLKQLLVKLRGGRTKVLITSRGDEAWLEPSNCWKLPLGGLDGEERWDFCEQILKDLGLTVDRKDEALAALMDELEGHPLMMRVVLSQLGSTSATAMRSALETNLAAVVKPGTPLQDKLWATLRFVEQSLPQDLRPLLVPLGLHETYVDMDDVEAMGVEVPGGWNRPMIDRFFATLSQAGLVRDIGANIYSLHPALTTFLKPLVESSPEREAWERAFTDRMARIADYFAGKQLHEQRRVFAVHEANFQTARHRAHRLGMDVAYGALTEALASFALHTHHFADATRLYSGLAVLHQQRQNAKGEAAAYHQLGVVAQGRRDFAAAEQWYLKSLAIKEKLGNEHGAATS